MRKNLSTLFMAGLLAFSVNGAQSIAAPVTLKMATDSGARGSVSGDALEYWAELIQEATKGTDDEIKVNVFYQEELGGQQEVFDLFVAGEVDMMLNWPSTSYDKRLGVRYTPYLFFTWEQAIEAYQPGGWLSDIYQSVHNDLGLHFFAAWPEGFAGVATKNRYATTVEDAKGIKVRTPANFPNPQIFNAMGYDAVGLPWGDVYTSLQTGVVDGDAGNTIYWDYEYFRDLIKYYVRTGHMFVTGFLTMNKQKLESLTDNQRKVIAEAASKVSSKQFKDAKEFDDRYVAMAKEHGIKYIELTEDERKNLAKTTRDLVWPSLEKEFGMEIVQQFREHAPEH